MGAIVKTCEKAGREDRRDEERKRQVRYKRGGNSLGIELSRHPNGLVGGVSGKTWGDTTSTAPVW